MPKKPERYTKEEKFKVLALCKKDQKLRNEIVRRIPKKELFEELAHHMREVHQHDGKRNVESPAIECGKRKITFSYSHKTKQTTIGWCY